MAKKSRHKKSRKAATGAEHHHKGAAKTAPHASTAKSSRAPGGSHTEGMETWYLAAANHAQQLLNHGQLAQATEAFKAILTRLGGEPSYARAAILERLGICHQLSGHPELAAVHLREAMGIAEGLAPSDGVKQLRGMLFSGLGDVLCATGEYGEARRAYESALKIAEALKNWRAQALDFYHLGKLALAEGRPDEARTHCEAALARFQQIGESTLEAVVWYQLGRTFQDQQQRDEAERHYREAARIREEQGDLAAAAQSWSQLAVLARETGDSKAAEVWHRKAIDADRKFGQRAQLARHLGDLADLLQNQPGRLEEARQLAQESLAIAQDLDPPVADIWRTYGILADITDKLVAATTDSQHRAALRAQSRDCRELQRHAPRILTTLNRLGDIPSYGRTVALERLARCFHMSGRPDLAAGHLNEALDITETLGPAEDVEALRGMLHARLGETLCVVGHDSEARAHYEAAVKIAEHRGDRLGQSVNLNHLGALALAKGELEQAQIRYREARALSRQIREAGMEALANHQLGVICQQTRQWKEAERHYREAAQIREAHGNLAGATQTWNQLCLLAREAGDTEAAEVWSRKIAEAGHTLENSIASNANVSGPADIRHDGPDDLSTRSGPATARDPLTAQVPCRFPATRDESVSAFEVTVHEDLVTEYVLDMNLLIDGPHERRIKSWTVEPELLDDHVQPMLAPCVRICMDEDGAIRFCLPREEPRVERRSDCDVMRRVRREVAVAGNPDPLWRLIRAMDGERTVSGILSELPEIKRTAALRLLAVLAATGPVDVSGRTIGRFIHTATKKGVLSGGGLVGDQVLELVTDGNYRAYPEIPQIAIGESVPRQLRDFHALTRTRRSRREYQGSLTRADFDALLHTACGTTGTLPWEGHEAKLRAYPSSGALYAVEIYPVIFRVEGLQPGIYHYRAVENVLEAIRPGFDRDQFLRAMLPVERDMVAGAAALICLAGNFLRHERKYGEGGYRMMVAEAGHISQTLILTATALGLTVRPFGGVFDDLVNQDLGLDDAQEQFLLAVLVGRSGSDSGDAMRGGRE